MGPVINNDVELRAQRLDAVARCLGIRIAHNYLDFVVTWINEISAEWMYVAADDNTVIGEISGMNFERTTVLDTYFKQRNVSILVCGEGIIINRKVTVPFV